MKQEIQELHGIVEGLARLRLKSLNNISFLDFLSEQSSLFADVFDDLLSENPKNYTKLEGKEIAKNYLEALELLCVNSVTNSEILPPHFNWECPETCYFMQNAHKLLDLCDETGVQGIQDMLETYNPDFKRRHSIRII